MGPEPASLDALASRKDNLVDPASRPLKAKQWCAQPHRRRSLIVGVAACLRPQAHQQRAIPALLRLVSRNAPTSGAPAHTPLDQRAGFSPPHPPGARLPAHKKNEGHSAARVRLHRSLLAPVYLQCSSTANQARPRGGASCPTAHACQRRQWGCPRC